jgi:hypothetical protein
LPAAACRLANKELAAALDRAPAASAAAFTRLSSDPSREILFDAPLSESNMGMLTDGSTNAMELPGISREKRLSASCRKLNPPRDTSSAVEAGTKALE